MNDLVKDVLKRDNEEQNRLLKSTEVIKPCPVDIDMGNLLVWDPNVIDQQSFTENKDEYIKQTMRDNMQLLVNALWQLPIERHDDVIVAKLPDAKQIVPRAKPIPKPKPLSKWQKFAQSKGIVKKKKKVNLFGMKQRRIGVDDMDLIKQTMILKIGLSKCRLMQIQMKINLVNVKPRKRSVYRKMNFND